MKNLNGHLARIVRELAKNGVTLEQGRREFERQFIVACLRQNGGNAGLSAQCLGIHRNTLRNKVSALGIGSKDYQEPPRKKRGPGREKKPSPP